MLLQFGHLQLIVYNGLLLVVSFVVGLAVGHYSK